MSKATETVLASLHNAVAMVLTAQLSDKEVKVTFNEDGEAVSTGEEVYTATPATIAAAIKFLKDNNITADEELSENMDGLREALAAKQKHSRLKVVGAEDFTG